MSVHFVNYILTGVVPVIMKPLARPKDENDEYVALQCAWDYSYDASHVEFNVRWFRDSNETLHKFEHKFNGTAQSPKVYESLYKHELRQEGGYEWNKRVNMFNSVDWRNFNAVAIKHKRLF